MKNQINEGFIDKLFGMIAKGRVDKVTKPMKDDPKFNIKKRQEIDNQI